MSRPIDQLDVHHVGALMRWKFDHGRTWKAALRQAWETGRYGASPDAGLLQQVRNLIGPRGLSRITLS